MSSNADLQIEVMIRSNPYLIDVFGSVDKVKEWIRRTSLGRKLDFMYAESDRDDWDSLARACRIIADQRRRIAELEEALEEKS